MVETQCPGCGETVHLCYRHGFNPVARLGTCPGCSGLIGKVDVRDYPKLVESQWETGYYDQSEVRYFDLDVISTISPDRDYRVHGWYVPRTRRVVQVG